ncbi:MAG: tRNA (adenosine(37)-N6)-threonylcarbamoyltransferase complex ATPase subunit type 1 TsaE [Actinomycetaceae bacterium]|nr:tRNA (adenosine(37)-N6)-threonylcarbamoyltransferase complex ATPase subunit type 1 TsaE [Actinomycetaceae bacterium]
MNDEWTIDIPTAEDMREYGRALGAALQAGDVVMLDGPLGAGKTTFTQGIAQGMGVSERITSPTYVIAITHRTPEGTPNLVHVDAYRLAAYDELDDLDLDSALEDSALVIEWGQGKAEPLSADRLDISIGRPTGAAEEENVDDLYEDAPRKLTMRATGERSQILADTLMQNYKEGE